MNAPGMPGFVDRVENDTVLVGNPLWPGEGYLITVWQCLDGGWVLTHNGADVGYRRTLTAATNDALRRLGLDPNDPQIERTDERPGKEQTA
jgi:hypothetical protein